MLNRKTLLAAAALAVLSVAGVGSASAAPRNDHHGPGPAAQQQVMRHDTIRRDVFRHDTRRDFYRPYVTRTRVYETLRLHRYAGFGDPYFYHGRYVVRSHDRFGRVVLVEILDRRFPGPCENLESGRAARRSC